MSYWVAVVARNAGNNIGATIDSLLNQTLLPQNIVVVNDGSSDDTDAVLEQSAQQHRLITILTLPDNGYDIRRVPQNINIALQANRNCTEKYVMISGDDCAYPNTYVQQIIDNMNNKIVVASGRPTRSGLQSHEHSPSGSGRIIRTSFLKEMGFKFPVRAGWEAWLLYQARMNGYETKLLNDLTYSHVRPRGTRHQFTYWGAAMYTLGYHPLYAFGRIMRNLLRNSSLKASAGLFRGYLLAILGSSDQFITPFESSLRQFVYREQTRQIVHVISSRFI
jgi:glycosyltransferase involved in cell wall biosynthesis